MARGRRRKGRAYARRQRGRRTRLPLLTALTAVPVGLALAATLLFTGAGERLDLIQTAATGLLPSGGSGEAPPEQAAVPDAEFDDDFFAAPSEADPAPTARPEPARQSAQATVSPSPPEEDGEPSADSARAEGTGGSGGGSGGGSSSGGSGGGGTGTSALTDRVVELTNAERAAVGCDPLRVDTRLTAAAQEHSEDMDARGYMSHYSPEGEGPGDRASRHGYDSWGAENVAKGQTSAAQVVEAWMNSEGHRRNILNCGLVALGVGESGYAWTQLFGWV
ncbi:CAP domain-containing protein [Nocardiopsis sp. CNT312]|uniref:CAP domain-containing protein n=1 Tax=Nocardiopsis sp. CNT312 TaxID=1137268 RepID=UPI0004908673|nr:CAP domain-containing protein [Nocardiopsis sp. CNT312]